MIKYEQWFQKVGVLNVNQFAKPRMFGIEKFLLPMASTYHYFNEEPFTLDIDNEIIRSNKGSKIVNYIEGYNVPQYSDLVGVRGMSKRMISMDILAWFRSHREFKNKSLNASLIATPNNLNIIDYSVMDTRYLYKPTYVLPYARWYNTRKAMYSHMLKDIETTKRHQFFELQVPTKLFPLSVVKQILEDYDRGVLTPFGHYIRKTILTNIQNDPSNLDIVDLILLFSPNRVHSLIGTIPTDKLDKINIILRSGAKYSIVNVGRLYSFVRTEENIANKVKTMVLDEEQTYRRLLAMFMAVSSARTIGALADEIEVDDSIDANDVENLTDDSLIDPTNNIKIDVNKLVRNKDHNFKVDNGGTGSGKIELNKTTITKSDGTVTEDGAALKLDKEITESIDESIEKDLQQLESLYKQQEIESEYDEDLYTNYVPPSTDPVEAILEEAQDKAAAGLLSAAEFRRFATKAERFKKMTDPFSGEGTLAEAIEIKPEDLMIKDRKLVEDIRGVIDKSMLSSSLEQLDATYIKDILNKDVANMVLMFQRAGIIVDNYTVTDHEDINDSYKVHTVRLIPVTGEPSTIKFRIPNVSEDGTFKAGGVIYRMRRQHCDLPVRKVKYNEVAMTSYFSKMFVKRSERANFDYRAWLGNQIVAKGVNQADEDISSIILGNKTRMDIEAPRAYTAISARVSYFVSKNFEFNFDFDKIPEWFEGVEVKSGVPIARELGKKGSYLVLGEDGEVIHVTGSGSEPMGSIEHVLGIKNDPPVDMVEVGLLGKNIPLGLLLAYEAGLGNMLKTLKVNYRTVKRGSPLKLTNEEFAVKFEDESLIFSRKEPVNALLFSGFNRYHREIKMFSRYDFDKKDAYGALFDMIKVGSRKLREVDFMMKMWIDPVTMSYLQQKDLPTDMFHLFVYAVGLLVNDKHSDQTDIAEMRDRGYERIAGMVYAEMIKSLRGYRSRPNSANATVNMNPFEVWMNILQDQTVLQIEQSNPIQSMKDAEVAVYRGAGGRDARSMTAPARKFHRNATGVVSEANVDNGDVGTITYSSADPNYDTVRGTSTRIDPNDPQTAQIFSTSFLLAPGADMDDPKRISFISIQNSQTTHCEGYTPMPTRTGYERVMIHRTPSIHGRTARMDGVIESVTDKVIQIRNTDGSLTAYELGRQYGKWSGKVMPHNLVTHLKVGDKVKKGDPLLFNTNYFTGDYLDPKQVLYKGGVLCRTALIECNETFEDSSAITKQFAKKLVTTGTHIRNIRVDFTQEIRNMIKVGETTNSDSILCTIYEPLAGMSDAYNDEALNTLQDINSDNPTAKYRGTVEKIEVLYCGDPEDMTSSLQLLTDKSDTALYKLNKAMKKASIDGSVEEGYRIDNIPMTRGSACIRVYITGPVGMGIADKVVFGNQMKSTIGSIITDNFTDKEGKPVDAIFGYDSLLRRIVLSAEFMGVLNTVLVEVGDRAVKAYEGK